MMKLLCLLLLTCGFSEVFSQGFNFLVCPTDWIPNGNKCYHFVNYPLLPYDDAAKSCQHDGSILLTVSDYAEHTFVASRLRNIDPSRSQWYTSGERDTGALNYRYMWTATNTEIPLVSEMWISQYEPVNDDKTRDIVAYQFDFIRGLYGLALISGRSIPRPYICEISKSEVYRIDIRNRGFDYGVPFSDLNIVKRGPKFTVDAKPTVIMSITPSVYMECIADGVPLPSYQWKRTKTNEVVSSKLDTRYTITNGRLSIQNPVDKLDAGDYQCEASNSEGTILGSPAQLSFATLGEFSNVQTAMVTPIAYMGAIIVCPDIPSRLSEGVRYQWMKDSIDGSKSGEFVRPELNTYLFISGSGRLLFSEVTSSDDGVYRCVATLTSTSQNQNYVGASQPPSRTSKGIRLRVINSGGGTYDPEIQDGFIKLVPSTAIAGMNISLECFAYGTMPMKYSWTYPRLDYDMHRYTLKDSKRILYIQNVNLDDSGNFSCTVISTRGDGSSDKTHYVLNVESQPTFLLPLIDQHLDVGTPQLTWRCEARAIPFPMYTWYKNGVLLQNSSNLVIHRNTLIITKLDKERDEGMYQCAANNSYGAVFSSGQLRILSIAPTFDKFPMSQTMSGAMGGMVIIPCNPEAAPFPVYTWTRNGANLNPPVDSTSRVRMLLNGDLEVHELTPSDQGQYECQVSNELGEASDRTYLTIYSNTQIFQPPSSVSVRVNTTAFLFCKASHNQFNLDLVYQWAFNGRIIDIDDDFHYRRGTPPDNEGGLYLNFAQFDHGGKYSCIARTQVDSANATATLSVIGPPSEPAGVLTYSADPNVSGQTVRDVILKWTDPVDTHGSPIDSYMIYGQTNYSSEVVLLKAYVPQPLTILQSGIDGQRRSYLIQNLKPGVSYKFQIRAVNLYGEGDASKPSRFTVIPSAAPIIVPSNIGGGGGSVGTLKITWDPLMREDHNGWGIGYIVEWRTKPPPGQELSNVKWNKAVVEGNIGHYSTLVGKRYYYLPYNVKVTPFNNKGEGPTGFNDTVFSAEEMPIGIATNIYASPFNESAAIVYWDPVKDNRDTMKGRLKGYKVNYWYKDTQTQEQAIQAIFYEDTDHALIIGLQPDTWYTFSVIVFNHAGNGPKSEVAHQSTDRSAPRDYPINVEVYPHGDNSVRVRFRGLSTSIFEEPLLGYKLRYWRDTDDIRNAKDVDCERQTECFMYQIQPDYLYHLRVLGYSMGGDGKQSSPETLFSYMGGRVAQLNVDPSTSEVLYVMHDAEDSAFSISVSMATLLISVTAAIFVF